MNRGYKVYLKEAKKPVKETLRSKSNFAKYYAYLFASLIGRLFIIPGSVFDLADVRLAKMVKDEKRISISESVKPADKIQSIWTMLLANFITAGIFLGGLLTIALVTVLLASIGVTVAFFSGDALDVYITAIYFSVPGAVALVIYLIIFAFYFAPLSYIVATDDTIGASEAVKKSIETMKRAGKKTVFVTVFLAFLKLAIIGGAMFGLGEFIYSFFVGFDALQMGFYHLVYVLGTFILLAVYGKVTLKCKVIFYELFDDIVINEHDTAKLIKGIDANMFAKKKFDVKSANENLVRLFDETSDVAYVNGKIAPEEVYNKKAIVVEDTSYAMKETPVTEKPAEREEKPAATRKPTKEELKAAKESLKQQEKAKKEAEKEARKAAKAEASKKEEPLPVNPTPEVKEEATAQEETAVAEEAPVTEEAPAEENNDFASMSGFETAEEPSVQEEAPAAEETPVAEEPAEETPSEDLSSMTSMFEDETPAAEVPSYEAPDEENVSTEEAPAEEPVAEETPVTEEAPSEEPAEEISAEETPSDENNEESGNEDNSFADMSDAFADVIGTDADDNTQAQPDSSADDENK